MHVFEVACRELEGLPRDARLQVLDNDTQVGWFPIDDLLADDPPFYPDGISALAVSLDRA